MKTIKKKKLKIAIFVASELPFPIPKDFPRPYAPLQVALDIAEGLAEKGHQITFFGPKGSKSKKFEAFELNFSPLYKNKILEYPEIRTVEREKIFNLFDQYAIGAIFKENLKKKFDIIHIHPIDRALPFGFVFKTPVVYTLHDPIHKWKKEIFELFQTKNQYFIAISKYQKDKAPNLNWGGVVYNGINLKNFYFEKTPKDYCLFFGRIMEKKGTREAIQAAKLAKEKLIILGECGDKKYWKKKIKPYLGKNIKYAGFLPYEKIVRYVAKAKVSLMPIKWDEPFGLTFIESMACGTPVIAFNRGSAKEVIKNGKTGFIVKNLSEMADAMKKIGQIDRYECRKWVEENFTIEKMVDGYEKVFFKILRSKN